MSVTIIERRNLRSALEQKAQALPDKILLDVEGLDGRVHSYIYE